ncbi:MAG: biopolymer transporter ExbD [Ferruginibacter sp.]|nr:biopolymer transporter ExbD [Chitinophagaceae bacterium]
MAEIETKRSTKKKKRLNKKSTRVDLTPMVDLGFLLLTFFVFTTALSQPMAMNLVVPKDVAGPADEVCESCVLTVILDKDNNIKYYEGAVENNPPVKETGFAPEEIRTILMQKKAEVERVRGSGDQFILIIKPAAVSKFKNFVDITDEVTICQIKKYYVDEIKDADKKLLLKK